MASNWLELQNELRSGARSLLRPSANGKCGTGVRSFTPNANLNLPSLSDATAGVNNLLGNIQGEIDQFGSEVMGVLNDIGAWIPPELQGFGGSGSLGDTTSTQAPPASQVADVTKIETQVSQGGNVIEQKGYNELTGDAFWQLRTAQGAGFRIDPNGSVILSSVKNPSTDPSTGSMGIHSEGPAIIKVNEYLAIEVNNDNDALAATNPSVKGTAMSLIVNGDLSIEVRSGNLAVKSAGNLTLDAKKSLELKGSDIKLFAGEGASPNAASSTTSTTEYGGAVDIRCGSYNLKTETKVTEETAKFMKVNGEYTIQMEDAASSLNINSAGDLDINVARDMLETIGGKKATTVLNTNPALAAVIATASKTPPMITAKAAYTINNKFKDITPATTSTPAITKPLLLVENDLAADGGVTFNLVKGDIIFSTKIGNMMMGNAKSLIADITEPSIDATLSPAIVKNAKTPGMYVGSDASPFLALYNASSTYMAAGKFTPGPTPSINSVLVTPASVNLTASAMTNKVIGAMVNNLQGAVTTSITGANTLNITGAKVENITGAKLANVTGLITDKSPTGVVIDSPGTITIKSKGAMNIESGGAMSIKANGGNITMTASAILLN